MLLLLMTLRLTLNRPAADALGSPSALKIDGKDGQVAIRSADLSGDPQVLPVQQRDRGGLECALRPDVIQTVLDITGVSSDRPYLILRSVDGRAYFRMEHYARAGVPGRHLPAARLWLPPSDVALDGERTSGSGGALQAEVLPFAAQVRRAHEVVETRSNQPGRPSAELLEARKVMAAFDTLVREIYPRFSPRISDVRDEVREAQSALERALAKLEVV